MKSIFYVYIHKRLDDGSIFYVGKGSGRRYIDCGQRNRHWKYIVAKHGFTSEIVKNNLDEDSAFSLERELISFYGRKNLCNYTNGGDGASGAIRTEEQKEAMRKKMLGRKILPEWKIKMSEYARNKPLSHRRKQAEAIMGRKHTEEHKRKIAESCTGRKLTDSDKKKISDYHKGKKKKPEAVLAMALSKSKAVTCDQNGVRYVSTREAARCLNLSSSKVSESARGGRPTKGFSFRFDQ